MKCFENFKEEYISFDVFDTLLYRDVKYYQIFEIVENKLINEYGEKYIGYSRIRMGAQKKVQSGTKVEATLDDIYDVTNYDNKMKQTIKSIEIATEIEHLHVNNALKLFIEKLKKCGKKIIITSDMYLSKNDLSYILEKKGIIYDKLYVSSDVQKRKSSGKLFTYIIKDLMIKKNNIIHIGDNIKSDFVIPRILSIKSILYKNKKNKIKSNNQDLLKIINNNYQDNYYREIGFNYFGPLLYGFCLWIDKIKAERKFDDLCFLSRDGQIVSKAYKILHPDNNYSYFLASRRTLTVPLLENANNFEEILKIVPYIKREESIKDLLSKIGVCNRRIESKIVQKYGNEISREELKGEKGIYIFSLIEKEMKKNSKEEKDNAIKYINENLSKGKIGLVDIGWYGTMQLALEKLSNEKEITRTYTGIYLGFLERYDNKNLDAIGYIYDYNRKKVYDDKLIFGFNGLIELMFTANHGSAKRYSIKDDKVICELEKDNGEYSEFVKELQIGALEFIEDAKKINLKINKKEAYANLLRLLTSPTKEECDIIGEEKFYDVYFEKIIQFNSWKDFVRNPKENAKKFLQSNWKIGFIKKMGLPFPTAIYRLLNMLKR